MRSLKQWADGPGPLGLARVSFGVLVLCRTTPLLAGLHVPYLVSVSPLLGWPTDQWHVAAFGLALPAGAVAALCVARTAALVLFTAGIRAREAGVAAGLLGWAVLAQDAVAYINTLHLLCLGLVVLALGGGGSTLAVLREREDDLPSARALVQALVVSVYAWSGLAKLNASWLGGDALARFHEAGSVTGPIADALASSPAVLRATAWIVVLTELAIGPLLVWRRTRPAAVVAALVFHAVLESVVHPDFFGFAMAILLLAFVGDPPAGASGAAHMGGGVPTPRQAPDTHRDPLQLAYRSCHEHWPPTHTPWS
jgi:hypothetical protein